MSLKWYGACWWISAHPWSKPLVKHMLRVHSCAHTTCRYPQLTGVHSSGCNNSDAINPIPAGQLFLWCSLGGTFQEVPSLIDVGVSGGQWAMRACVGVGRRKKKTKPGLRLHKENRSATKRTQTFRRCKAFKKHNRLGSCQTRGPPLLRPRQLRPHGRARQDTPCPPSQTPPWLVEGVHAFYASQERTRSFIDFTSQIRTVEEATHCRDEILLVCFSLFCNKVSLQFQETQYPKHTELAKQIFQGVILCVGWGRFLMNIKRNSVRKH